MTQHFRFLLLGLALAVVASSKAWAATSFYPLRPDDPHAVYLERGPSGARGDGVADDSDAIQSAINRVQETTLEGIVFIPEGRYRLTKTVYLWSGIRLIGVGTHRPVFVLGENTPGFQTGFGSEGTGRYMVYFASRRPEVGTPPTDANEFTFYSGISNIDFEIRDGNPAAIAVRFHVAQHSFLSHMDFHVGTGRAAIEDVGNQASDLHIEGGEYGIITKVTSPAWQFLLMDSSFAGQRVAAIHTQEAGLTLVRDRFAHVPVAIEIAEERVEQLYGRDLEMVDVRRAALVLGNALGNATNARVQVNLESVRCTNVPHFLEATEGVPAIAAPSPVYLEEHLSVGLEIGDDGRERGFVVRHRERPLALKSASADTGHMASDIPALPPMSTWNNVHMLGVKGDGSDDTAALQAAVDKHRTLYLPSGVYRLTGSLRLRRDTMLIGLSPATTQLVVADGEKAFQRDLSSPSQVDAVPVLISARGGTGIITGLGIVTGAMNPRAVGLIWLSGSQSMVEDVNLRGRARSLAALAPAWPQGLQPAPGAPPSNDQDTQYPSLWVKDGGGGIFRDIWTANTAAQSGLRIENTATPGVVYQLSCEHHMHNEVQVHHASKWRFHALQTEEEKPAGAEAVAIELEDAHDLTFANLFMYRVSRNVMPKLYAVMAQGSSGIRFENVHNFSQTRLAFDNSVFEHHSGVMVRAHDFTLFTLRPEIKPAAELPLPGGIFASDAKLTRLATGLSNTSGLTADDAGRIYFTDAAMHKVYAWDEATKKATVIADTINLPMVLGFVSPATLLAVDYGKAVFSLNIGDNEKPQPITETDAVPQTRLLLPVGLHNDLETFKRLMEHRGYTYARGSNTAVIGIVQNEHRGYFYAPGTTTAIMAGGTWRPLLQSSQLTSFAPGDTHFAISEDDGKTYFLTLNNDHTIAASVFVQRGGTSVVTDAAGNVYIASGQIFIYDRSGKQIGVLEVPERPSSLAFGGTDRRTLFIGARGSLYAIQTAAPGR